MVHYGDCEVLMSHEEQNLTRLIQWVYTMPTSTRLIQWVYTMPTSTSKYESNQGKVKQMLLSKPIKTK
ncbi:hypothetical protein CUMW_058150 [Citrus unshiu]|nr:hypothetical protein CUMW_058150 [Citrus unshiu]